MLTKQRFSPWLALLLLLAGRPSPAQSQPAPAPFALGTPRTLVQQLRAQLAGPAQQSNSPGEPAAKPTVALQVSPTETFTGQVNYQQALGEDGLYVVGQVLGVPDGSFHLRVAGQTVEGDIVLYKAKRAFRYSAAKSGQVVVAPIDINKVICVDLPPHAVGTAAPAQHPANASKAAVVSLQSLPGARGVVFLDFDGFYLRPGTYWNSGNAYLAPPSGLSDADILTIWQAVSEDFRPFNLNVTTDEAVFNAYPVNMRGRCVVTNDNKMAPGAGGVAHLGSFAPGNDDPCWVFSNAVFGTTPLGDAISHEFGHIFGLQHDGRTNPQEEYYAGQGDWGPIMGVAYNRPISQWSRGEYAYANRQEDDVAIIGSSANRFGFRNDDYGREYPVAGRFVQNGNTLTQTGVIERPGDVDWFVFDVASPTTIYFSVTTPQPNANLDIKFKLYGTYLYSNYLYRNPDILYDQRDDPGLNVNAGYVFTPGAISPCTYYISVEGTGAGNPATDGYSNYGSLGSYTVTATVASGSVTPVPKAGPVVVATQNSTNARSAPGLPATLELYPNPVSDRLVLQSAADLSASRVQIMDAGGKVVWQGAYANEGLDLGGLAPGLYNLTATMPDQRRLVQRFVKQ